MIAPALVLGWFLAPRQPLAAPANAGVPGRRSCSSTMSRLRIHVTKLEERFGKAITIKKSDPAFHVEQFEVFGKQ